MRLHLAQLAPFAAALDLDLERMHICLACLSFVSGSLCDGDEREARSWTRRLTPLIWEEGLAESALAAVRKACRDGLRRADVCLADLEARGGRSVVARAIVLRLGAELAERERTAWALHEAARERLELAPPDWN